MRRGLGVIVGLGLALSATLANAVEPASNEQGRSDPWGLASSAPYVRFEGDGFASPGAWPNPSLGGDVAVVAGRPGLHGRFAVGAMGTPTFTLGERGKVGTIVETSDLRLCAAGHRSVHRVRLCGGMQAGVMHMRWLGFEEPGRRDLPWFSVVGGGDYAIAIGRVVDLHAGIGLGIPLVRHRLVTRTRGGELDGINSGPFSSTFRLGIGFRLG